MSLVPEIGLRIHAVGRLHGHRRAQWLLVADSKRAAVRIQARQRQGFDSILVAGGGQVAVGQEQGVGRLVVTGVKRPQIFVAQLRDLSGITAAVLTVRQGREQLRA